MATTKIKCPVEGVIDLDRLPGVPATLVTRLIDAPEMQRLRRIRQLGFSELVYPGATHTRFAHSLGAFQGAQRTLTQLRSQGHDVPDPWTAATALACLLHDLGHGPFSHTFERVTGTRHEERTLEIVRQGPQVPRVLEAIAPGTVDRVGQLLTGQVEVSRLRWLADLVSSALDCDRMDYLRRDALSTGAQYGAFDRDWLIREITPTDDGAAIVVIEKGRTAVEQYLIGRYHMFQNVYLHKASRGFEGAFRALCARVRHLGVGALPTGTRGLDVLFDASGDLDRFLSLTDEHFQLDFELLVDHDDPTLRALARCLHLRRAPRSRSLQALGGDDEAFDRLLHERRERAAAAGFDPEVSVWVDEAQDVPYRPYTPETSRRGLRVQREDGVLVDVTELSPSLKALAQRIVVRRLYWLDPERVA
ncbi:MAG TPA: HD domain-containing protein [Candidatus Krumholzibacteria bacterium]|nr:HD domain-containing protein [Candidatus Krumholzibacteria bacterium]